MIHLEIGSSECMDSCMDSHSQKTCKSLRQKSESHATFELISYAECVACVRGMSVALQPGNFKLVSRLLGRRPGG